MSTIQVLKPKFHIDECLAQIRECLEKGWTGSGFKTAEFEQKWKEYMKDMPINFKTASKEAQGIIAKDFLKTRNLTPAQAVEILKGANNGKQSASFISL